MVRGVAFKSWLFFSPPEKDYCTTPPLSSGAVMGRPSAKSLAAVLQPIIATGLPSRWGRVSGKVTRISKPRAASP